jgi:hypothetical protein
MSPNSKPTPETFPELPDCIIWIRFFLALVYGLMIGLQPNSRGAVNIMFAVNLVSFVPFFYATTYLGATQEEYGTKLIYGGVPQGIALVLLIWLYFYTEFHVADEAALKAAFSKLAESQAVDPIVDSSTESPGGAESEF